MIVEHEFLGMEFDWLAVDEEGRVGYFSTAGAGPMPAEALERCEAFDAALEWTATLPIVAESIAVLKADHFTGDWESVATRGIYAYDWRREKGAYMLVAKPSTGIVEAVLPEDEVGAATRGVRLGVRFGTEESIS